SYYFHYMYNFLEYPYGLNDIKRIELKDSDESFNFIIQIQVLFHKCKKKSGFYDGVKKFFYVNYVSKSEICSENYKFRKDDMKLLLFQKKKNGHIHPGILSSILKKTNHEVYKSLLSKNVKHFINARIRDIKNQLYTRVNVLFIFYILHFSLNTLYEIDKWFYDTVKLSFTDCEYNPPGLPQIIEYGMNEWCVVYRKKNKNNFKHEDPIMYYSNKEYAFLKVIKKYFSILRDINSKFIKWRLNLVDISDFLKLDVTPYINLLNS
ncbi:unnamed protein product, partial [marine sediment metagenome]